MISSNSPMPAVASVGEGCPSGPSPCPASSFRRSRTYFWISWACLVLKAITSCRSCASTQVQDPVRSNFSQTSVKPASSSMLPSTLATSSGGCPVISSCPACGGTTTALLREAAESEDRKRANRLAKSLGKPVSKSTLPSLLAFTKSIMGARSAATAFFSCSRCLTSNRSSGLLLEGASMFSFTPASSSPDREKKRPTVSAAPSSFHVNDTSSVRSDAARCASKRSSSPRCSGRRIKGPS
mmetsp:Transcript_21446/g.49957  ORF Transcript_21446/g.49957 Transcript_21446/m.49957 type:complete len:240 (-) Transcript_21446:619-1338(-)